MDIWNEIAMGSAVYPEKLNGLTPRENLLLAYNHKMPVTVPFTQIDGVIFWAGTDLERYAGTDRGKDGFGVEWQFEPSVGAPMPVGEPVLKNIENWREEVTFPNLEAIDWEQQAYDDLHVDMMAWVTGQGVRPLPNGESLMQEGKAGICFIMNGMFERLHALMGVSEALVAMATEPEHTFDFFSALADWKIAYIQKIAQYYPADIINAHDDYGAGDRLFVSLPMWRELIKPNLKRIVDATHQCGLIYQHHSCGYVEPLLPELIEIGVDALDPFMGNCNPNVKELKEQYSDQLVFCGGFDNINVFDRADVTQEEIRDEFRRVLDNLAPGGNYVIHLGGLLSHVPQVMAEYFNYGTDFYRN